ncbi:MAG: potassium-transporting ATPase subunit F [Armatimonadetes bacterium]|nr:potassium-transporting ATPase subunit F [Armatimonadota bacterium]
MGDHLIQEYGHFGSPTVRRPRAQHARTRASLRQAREARLVTLYWIVGALCLLLLVYLFAALLKPEVF